MRWLLTLFICCNYLFLSAQSINPDFGQSGRTVVNFVEKTRDDYNAVAITINKNNEIVLGGDFNREMAVHKLKQDGSDEQAFGYKAFSFFDIGHYFNHRIEETLTDSSGNTLAIGHAMPHVSLANRYNVTSAAVVIRLLPNGQPDPSFGKKGKAIFIENHLSLRAFTAAIQPDGKIVVACRGHRDVAATAVWDRIMLVRFTTQGIIDSTFGTNGGFIIPNFGSWSFFYSGDMALAIQPDGKIILGDIRSELDIISGSVKASPAVYRIKPQGVLDSTFATNGMFADRFGYDNYAINSVLVQPDNKIVVAGNTFGGAGAPAWLMFRLNSTGTVDNTFATNGVFTFKSPGWLEQSIGHIQMQGSDRIIAAGYHNNSSQGVLDIFRMKLNGTFDSSFAQNTVIYQRSMQSGFYFSGAKLALDGNQGIAALAFTTFFSNRNTTNIGHALVRLSKDGVLLPGFNTTGYKISFPTQNLASINDYKYGSVDRFNGIARLSSGKIIMAGSVYSNNLTKKDIGVTRLLATGKIDSSFSQNGRRMFPEIGFQTRMRAFLHLQNDWLLMNIDENNLIKIDSTGNGDPSFGTNGQVSLSLPDRGGFPSSIKALAEQQDKKILVLTENHILRLNTNGSIDNSFGSSGRVSMNLNGGIGKVIRVQPDGKIVVGAESGTNLMFRCNPNGTPDNSFGPFNNGYAFVHVVMSPVFEEPFISKFIDFEIQPDGKFVVLCMKDRAYGIPNSTPYSNYRDIITFRLNANGLIDNSFGGYPNPLAYQGTSHLSLPFTEEVPGDLLLAPDGKLLIAAYLSNGTGWDVGLVQLKNNGHYDTTCTIKAFATAGMDNIVQNRAFENELNLKLVPGANGTYLVGGTQMGQNQDFMVVNFLAPSSPAVNYKIFDAAKDTSCLGINLSWQTDYECAVDSFYVEYSKDGNVFTKVGSVRATTSAPGNYVFTHKQADYGNNYYRLRLYSNGSTYSLSPVRLLPISNAPVASIDWQNTIITDRDSVFDVTLNWNTQFEQESTSIEVQISTDSVSFNTIKSLPSAGNSSSPKQYSTTISGLPPRKYYFRLLVKGSNCRKVESTIISSLFEGCKGELIVAPNPVRGILKVYIPLCEKGDIRIVNVLGQVVSIIRNVNAPYIEIDCNHLSAATYFLQFFGEKTYTVKFMKL